MSHFVSFQGGIRKIRDKISKVISSTPQEAKVTDTWTVNGVEIKGFMTDFKIISKIKKEHWHNVSGSFTSNAVNVVPTNFVISSGATNSITSPFNQYISINNEQSSLIETEEATETKEATGVDGTVLISAKEAFTELETIPNPFSLLDLDNKLKVYNNMLGLVRCDTNRGTSASLKDIIERFEARKHYRDKQKVRDFFNRFQHTSDDKINLLLDNPKHSHLKIGPVDDFIPELPPDALEIMVDYAKEVVNIINKKPVFYIIAKATDFKVKKEDRVKRDPILLVQSPFSFSWDILGAWDEELMLLNEL